MELEQGARNEYVISIRPIKGYSLLGFKIEIADDDRYRIYKIFINEIYFMDNYELNLIKKYYDLITNEETMPEDVINGIKQNLGYKLFMYEWNRRKNKNLNL